MRQRAASVDLARERRLGRVAGAVALLAVACSFAALLVSASAPPVDPAQQRPPDRAEQLTSFSEHQSRQEIGAALRIAGLVLVSAFSPYLFLAVRARRPEVSPAVLGLGIVGPLLIAAATAYGLVALRDVADEFARSVPRTPDRAEALIERSAALDTARLLDIASRVVFGIWLAALSFQAMRTGLLTLFLGVWGIGAGVATTLLLPVGESLFVGWLASVAFLSLGWWWGGRPPAWDEGRAMPWNVPDEGASPPGSDTGADAASRNREHDGKPS